MTRWKDLEAISHMYSPEQRASVKCIHAGTQFALSTLTQFMIPYVGKDALHTGWVLPPLLTQSRLSSTDMPTGKPVVDNSSVELSSQGTVTI